MNEPSPVESFQLTWPRPLIIQRAYKSIMRQADKHPTAKQICIRVLKRSGMCVCVCVCAYTKTRRHLWRTQDVSSNSALSAAEFIGFYAARRWSTAGCYF